MEINNIIINLKNLNINKKKCLKCYKHFNFLIKKKCFKCYNNKKPINKLFFNK